MLSYASFEVNPSLRRRRSTADGVSPGNSHQVTEGFKAMRLNDVCSDDK